MGDLFGTLVSVFFSLVFLGVVFLAVVWGLLRSSLPKNYEPPYTLIRVDRMNGHVFEAFVAELLHSRGFSAGVTSASGDFGADVIAAKAGTKYAIQCKRNAIQNKVSVRAVQEAVAAVPFYDCDKSMVITSGYFTKQAVQYASKVGCALVGRDILTTWIKDFEHARRDAADKLQASNGRATAKTRAEELKVALAKIDDVERARRDAADKLQASNGRATAKTRAEELKVALAKIDDVERARRDAASRNRAAAKARAEELKVTLAKIDDVELLSYLERCKVVVLRELAIQLGASQGYSRRKANLVKRIATHIEKQRANY